MKPLLKVKGVYGTLWDPAVVDEVFYDCLTPAQSKYVESPHTRASAGMSVAYGISGSRPTDLVASSGQLSFTLDNGVGSDEGRYSPEHANVRQGWKFGTPVRLVLEETYFEAVMASEPWGYWRLDEQSGSNGSVFRDSSGNERHATVTTTTTTSIDAPIGEGSAIRAGNVRAYPAIVGPRLNDVITVEWWFRYIGTSAHSQQFAPAGPRNTGVTDPPMPGWATDKRGTTEATSTIAVRIDTSAGANQVRNMNADSGIAWNGDWHHVVLVINSGVVKWYRDGAFVNQSTYNHGTGFANPDRPFEVAAAASYGQDSDEVAIYDRELSPEEIAAHYAAAHGTEHIKHEGRVASIHPTPGQYENRTVVCTSYDRMRDLIAAGIPDLPIATNQQPRDLIATVLDAAPPQAQPVARDLGTDPVSDVLPVAFVGGDSKVGGLLQTIAISVLGTIYLRGDGTFVWRSRHDRAKALEGPIVLHADDAVLTSLTAATTREGVYTRVETTTHPRHVETNNPPTTVVYAASGTPLEAGPGTTTLWVDYRHPDDAQTLIAARDVLTTATPYDHYEANTAKDGSGSDFTALVSISILPFGTRARVTITNPTTSRVYLVQASDGEPHFRIIGNAILDEGQRTFKSVDESQPIDQSLTLDLPLVDSDTIGQSFAEWLRLQHSIPNRVQEIQIRGTTPRLRSIIARLEVGQHLIISEAITGLSSVDVLVSRITIDVPRSGMFTARLTVLPLRNLSMWTLGTSTLGVDTVLGV